MLSLHLLGTQGGIRGESKVFTSNMVSWKSWIHSDIRCPSTDGKVGDVVRIAPNELVFCGPQAYRGKHPLDLAQVYCQKLTTASLRYP